ncbi:MAG: glycosyltransferase [Bacteroidales bacterium]
MIQNRITGQDFVFTGLQPWDISIGSNAKDIALEISKNNRVLYVNSPLVKWSAELRSNNIELRNRIEVLNKRSSVIRQINPNLWVLDCPFTVLPVNKLPDGFLFDIANRLNNKKIFRYIAEIAQSMGFKNLIHFIDNDIYRSFYSDRFLHADTTIYYLRDNLLAIDFWRRHACRLEPQLIAKSDLVFCNSLYLAEKAKKYNSKTHYVGQGFDPLAYQKHNYPIPDDISSIPRPIVGYLGAIISARLDPELVFSLAKENPAISFVLVGGADDVFNNHPLMNLPNLFYLGSKPVDQVPDYINSFDICINPQLVNDLTIGNYPRKIDEYLAMGKPVIATKTDAMAVFKDHVYLCNNVQEYQNAMMTILQKGVKTGKEERIQFANTHTWEASVDRMYQLIRRYK